TGRVACANFRVDSPDSQSDSMFEKTGWVACANFRVDSPDSQSDSMLEETGWIACANFGGDSLNSHAASMLKGSYKQPRLTGWGSGAAKGAAEVWAGSFY